MSAAHHGPLHPRRIEPAHWFRRTAAWKQSFTIGHLQARPWFSACEPSSGRFNGYACDGVARGRDSDLLYFLLRVFSVSRMKRYCLSVAAALLLCSASFPYAHAANEASGFYEDALVRFERKDDAGAIIQLKNALKADPELLAAHLLMGRAALRKGDYAAAEVALREAQRRGVSRAEYVLSLGELLLATGRQKELLESIQPSELPAGLKYDVMLLRARAHQELSQYPQAIAIINDARALNPNAASALALHSRIALEAGRPDEAATLAEQASAMGPADTDAWGARAAVAYSTGRLPVALEHYDRALKLSPDNKEALLGRSSVLMDLGRMAEAKVSLLALAKADQAEPRSAYLRAVIADLEGDRDGSRKLLGEVVNLIDPLPRSALTTDHTLR